MKGIYLSIIGLAFVNLIQFFTELITIDTNIVLAVKMSGFILLLVGAVLSYKQGKTIEIPFKESEFKSGTLIIPFQKFKKKLPIVHVFQVNPDGQQERIMIDVKHSQNYDLVIGESAQAFNGKLIIK